MSDILQEPVSTETFTKCSFSIMIGVEGTKKLPHSDEILALLHNYKHIKHNPIARLYAH
jgi:hypothetical protein